MAISLLKGGNLNLPKTDPSLKQVLIGLRSDARSCDSADVDLDTSIFTVTENSRVRTDSDSIFYGQFRSSCGSREHTGDNRGTGNGDDEALRTKLDHVPAAILRLVVAVMVHNARARKQNFGTEHNDFIRLVNSETNVEIARFELSEDSSTEKSMVFGEVYRYGGECEFKAVRQGYAGGLRALAIQHGAAVQ